jgi:hypothetical protein
VKTLKKTLVDDATDHVGSDRVEDPEQRINNLEHNWRRGMIQPDA